MAAMLVERADDGWTWRVVDGVDGQRNARGDAPTELDAYKAAHAALNIASGRESNVREILRVGCCEVIKRAEAAEEMVARLQRRVDRQADEIGALRARVAGAEAGVHVIGDAMEKLRVRAESAEARSEGLERLLSEGLEIVESLSAGYDVWAAHVRRILAAAGGA